MGGELKESEDKVMGNRRKRSVNIHDGWMSVCAHRNDTSTAASHQGTVKAEQKLHMSHIFWLNIPVIKKIIL